MPMFEHAEDNEFFEELLKDVGGAGGRRKLFDLRDPDIKRREFGLVRNQIHAALCSMEGECCQLKCHRDCSNSPDEVDHLIPLKTNVLRKELRGMRGQFGKKVPSLSYGSNDPANLVLSCRRCNAFKKHRMPSAELVARILSRQCITRS